MNRTNGLVRPEAVLFDMGGVLTDSVDAYDEENYALSFPNGPAEDAPHEAFMELSRDYMAAYLSRPLPRPTLDPRPVVADWLRRRGLEADAGLVERWRRVLAQWEVRPVYPWVRPALESLHRMGIRMGVVSNVIAVGEHHRDLFRAAGILEFLDVTVFSSEFGRGKPHPSIFLHALERMGVTSEKAWYVGDKPQRDVCGARGVGMTAVLVDGPHDHRVLDAPANAPDVRVRDVSELPTLIARL